MARWNGTLLKRLPQPVEVLPGSECGNCEDEPDAPHRLVVAAKWAPDPDDVFYHNPETGRSLAAEYLCPNCGLVFENSYYDASTGNNFYSERPDLLLDPRCYMCHEVGKPRTQLSDEFHWQWVCDECSRKEPADAPCMYCRTMTTPRIAHSHGRFVCANCVTRVEAHQ